MKSVRQALLRARVPVGALGLATLTMAMLATHAPTDDGLSATDIDALTLARLQADAAEGESGATTGALLWDFVEPEDGEGGSEGAIAELVDELESQGVDMDAAGFYSETEHLFRMHGDAGVLAKLRDRFDDHALVEGVEPELLYSLPNTEAVAMPPTTETVAPNKPDRFLPNDPMFTLQWHMDQIRAPEAWTITKGKGAVVAVIDTGVAYKNDATAVAVPDLAGTEFTKGKSFTKAGLRDGLDDHAHGTHVAGTIAQTTHNGIGVTGVAHEAVVMPLKVLTKEGRGSVADIANAVRYAADEGAQVINMSLGGPLPSRVLSKAVEYAHDQGVTVICAAGNEHRSRVGYPAANKGAVAIAAVDFERNLTFYSNWGKDIDIAAPGGDTRADKNGDGHPDGVLQNTIKIQDPAENDYLWFQGTSMASPHAAGVAALVVASGVTNPDEVERVLKQTAVHPKGVEWDDQFGAGIIDARAAVGAAKGSYAPERGGLAGLLGLLGLAGFGVAGLRGRSRRMAGAGFVAGAVAASGALGTKSLAYAAGLGIGGLGTGLWLSAAVPVVLALLLLGVRELRGLLTGLSLGWAALLLHGAIVLPTLLTGIPGGPAVDRLWLVVNALVALWLARRISSR